MTKAKPKLKTIPWPVEAPQAAPEPLVGLAAPSPMQFVANYQAQVLRARAVSGVDGRGPKERERKSKAPARAPTRIRQRKAVNSTQTKKATT